MYHGFTRFCVLALSCLMIALLTGCVDTVPVSEESTRHAESGDRFITYDNGTALDRHTNLMWMTRDYRNLNEEAPSGWRAAMAWLQTMNQQRYGGYSDWRVPTIAEYQAIYQPTKPKRSYNGKVVGYPLVFADGGGVWFWTSEVAESGSDGSHVHTIYTFSFRSGSYGSRYVGHVGRDEVLETTGSLRLVRGPVLSSVQSPLSRKHYQG